MTPTSLHFVRAAGIVVGMLLPMSTLDAQAGGAALTLSSTAFKDGQPIPEEYTDYGKGKSIPLSWSHLPRGTRSLRSSWTTLTPRRRVRSSTG
jgi:uncharacterized protein YndB with AHSA1/START domain